MDGKGTSTNRWQVEDALGQVHRQPTGSAYALVRTITSCLISSGARVCLDAHPVPAQSNETTVFAAAFGRLLEQYDGLFRLVLYDSGANSAKNAGLVVAAGKDYLFRVQAEQPTLFEECQRLLSRKQASTAVHTTTDCAGGKVTTRRIWLSPKIAGYHDYPGLQTAARVQSVSEDKTTGEVCVEDRYFVCSLAIAEMNHAHWLAAIRRHWLVENACHNTWDRLFREDDRPWVKLPAGMLNVMLLRRIAYNLMSLFRSVTQRSEKERTVPWKRLMKRFYNTFITANAEMLAGLRRLTEPTPTR